MTYDNIGKGIPLVLIHGFPHDRSLWRPQTEGLQAVAQLIVPDLRGFGGSEDPPGAMSMDAYAADLKALLESLEIKQAVICGLSMGGYIALAFLANHPDMVKGLILCNTRAGADSAKARAGREATALKVEAEGVEGLAEEMLPKMLTEATIAGRPDLSASIKAMMAGQRPAGVTAALRGMAARPDRTSMLGSIGVPSLVITGSADALILPNESQAMADAIPRSRLVVIPDVAHLSNVEDPEAFNEAVQDFLAGIEQGRTPAVGRQQPL